MSCCRHAAPDHSPRESLTKLAEWGGLMHYQPLPSSSILLGNKCVCVCVCLLPLFCVCSVPASLLTTSDLMGRPLVFVPFAHTFSCWSAAGLIAFGSCLSWHLGLPSNSMNTLFHGPCYCWGCSGQYGERVSVELPLHPRTLGPRSVITYWKQSSDMSIIFVLLIVVKYNMLLYLHN